MQQNECITDLPAVAHVTAAEAVALIIAAGGRAHSGINRVYGRMPFIGRGMTQEWVHKTFIADEFCTFDPAPIRRWLGA